MSGGARASRVLAMVSSPSRTFCRNSYRRKLRKPSRAGEDNEEAAELDLVANTFVPSVKISWRETKRNDSELPVRF
jgi:hypothetical protein